MIEHLPTRTDKTGSVAYRLPPTAYCLPLALAALILLPLMAGCSGGDGIDRVTVSGKVTFDGQPVSEGQIRFAPKPGTTAPVSIAAIENGLYSFDGYKGVPVGSHLVEIRAYNPDEPAPRNPGEKSRTQLIPEKYNSKSELDITVSSGSGSVTKDFDLQP